MLTDSLVNTLVSKSGARWVVADALVEQRRRSAGAAAQGAGLSFWALMGLTTD